MPAEKSVSKASENRRSNKPLMEKRRRARINQSLTELKALILDAVKKDNSRHSKLEKADILEMTVKYLQNLQRQQTAANAVTESNHSNRFRAGFGECASEVSRFLESAEGFEAAVRTRLLGHLTSYLNGLERTPSSPTVPHSGSVPPNSSISSSSSTVTSSAEPSPRATPSPGIANRTSSPPPPSRERTVSPTVSADVDINNNTTSGASSTKTCSVSTATTTVESVFSGLQLIPTRLANGEIAFILPTHYAVAAAQALALGRIETLPVLPVTSTDDSVSTWSRTEQESENSRFTQTGNDLKNDSDLMRNGEVSTSPRTVDSENELVGRPATSPQEKQPIFMSLDESVWRPW